MTINRKNNGNEGYFRIGELAKRTGVTQRTLRFYEERGLLEPSSRFDSGMRLYADQDVERVRLIRQLQETLGFSLAEIKEIVAAEEPEGTVAVSSDADSPDDGPSPLSRAVDLTRSQLSLISHKVAKLERMREQLEQKLIQYLEEPWAAPRRSSSREAARTNGR